MSLTTTQLALDKILQDTFKMYMKLCQTHKVANQTVLIVTEDTQALYNSIVDNCGVLAKHLANQ